MLSKCSAASSCLAVITKRSSTAAAAAARAAAASLTQQHRLSQRCAIAVGDAAARSDQLQITQPLLLHQYHYDSHWLRLRGTGALR
jgi:hypothetical protein